MTPEARKEWYRKWYSENRERIRQYGKDYYQKNKDRIREQEREKRIAARSDPELRAEVYAKHKRWRDKNRDKIAAYNKTEMAKESRRKYQRDLRHDAGVFRILVEKGWISDRMVKQAEAILAEKTGRIE
jgi:hypothetical protein